MKILMLTPYLPYPPASGGQIRTFYLLKYLSQWHDITLVALYKNEEEKKHIRHLHPFCKKIYLCKRAARPWQPEIIIKAIFSVLPFLIVRNYSKEAVTVIKQLLKNETYDVIHAETFYIMPHIPPTSTPILLVEQTIEYKVYQHFISHLFWILRKTLELDIKKLKHWELLYWKKADQVATVSETDHAEMKRLIPALSPAIIPNGAGDEMFVDKLEYPDISKPILLFVGNFYWLQNVEAADLLIRKIFPSVRALIPDIKLIVAGQNSAKLKDLKSKGIQIIDLAPGASEKVKSLYHTSTLFVAPIFGPGGTRLKILASMAAGLPVISTRTGIDGLGVVEGEHGLIAETPTDFALAIQRILLDKKLYLKIQKNAFDQVKKNYSWSSIAKVLDNIYRKMDVSKK